MRVLNQHRDGKDVPGAVYIGRPSKYGNPVKVAPDSTREHVVLAYRKWLAGQPDLISQMQRELAGRDLLCWCAPNMCHGHVIREIVMGPELVRQGYAEKPSQVRVYDARSAAVFSKAKERYGDLGNMTGGSPLYIGDLEIATTEAFYQALRFPEHPDVQDEVLRETSGFMAKKVAYQHLEKTRKDWFRVNLLIMKFALQIKLCEHHDRIGDVLSATTSLPIVERSTKDSFWGAKPYKGDLLVGQNILGRLWMGLRAELVDDPDIYTEHVEVPDVRDLRLCGQEICDYEPRHPRGIQTSFDL